MHIKKVFFSFFLKHFIYHSLTHGEGMIEVLIGIIIYHVSMIQINAFLLNHNKNK